MSRQLLEQLYADHAGKVSDKWSLYLTEYARIFAEYRNRPVRLLEIGIQNGGSLEIWSKYFPHAQKLVGCDINPDCARLCYEAAAIAVVVGDANSESAQTEILGHAPAFDVIIDDGSHRSSDVVKSFARYFPHLADGGVFVAEDLHCSYWQEFEGGLFHPFSSMTFFKRLADVVSHEHWGIAKARTEILRGFCAQYGCEIDEEALQHIHSIEFINSMCVIRKAEPERNRLGPRVIVGSVGAVVSGRVLRLSLEEIPDQTDNEWTARRVPPDEELPLRLKELAERDGQIANLQQAMSDRDAQITDLKQAVVERDAQIGGFGRAVADRDGQIVGLKQAVLAYQNSTSWRVTKPMRFIGDQIKRITGGCSARILGFLRGETQASRSLANSSRRFHIDTPQLRVVNIVRDSYAIAGWAVDLAACSAVKVRFVVGHTIHNSYARQCDHVQRQFASVCELPARTGFAIKLAPPVGVHRMRIEVEGLDGSWIPVRRALLLRMPALRRARPPEARRAYSAWTRLEEKRLKAAIPDIKRHIELMVHEPTFTVVVDTRQGRSGLRDTIRSIRKQFYPFWDVRVLSGAAASFLPAAVTALNDMSLADIRGDFIVFMQSGQRLARNALYEFAAAINRRPDIDLIYGDEDSLAAWGSRCNPFHKPGWSPDYLETFNYIGFAACFRATLARGCFHNVHVYDFVLRFTERTTRVLHLPKILGHDVERHRAADVAPATAVTLNLAALSGRLSRTGRRGSVYEHELHKGCYAMRLDLKRSPLVSVVIPTAGRTVRVGERRIDLIENVIGQIRARSTYSNIEIIVVDNGDLSPDQLRVIAEAECRRITYSEPLLNISKKLNLGVSIARGELLLLLNDDIEILTPAWIERLLEHFEKPHVGVVGAKLLYPNELTQHVGVVHNLRSPDHVRRRFPRNDAGYFFSTCGVRNYSAVTGACMLTPARVYREVGGYSDELAVSFNDVDFCMKVRRKGLSVVYAPDAELIHMESLSRSVSLDMRELEWYRHRWAAEIGADPFYNAGFLTVAPPTFVPRVNQRMP